jgi:hypothetical protein
MTTMPSSVNPAAISAAVQRVMALGTDNVNMWVNDNRQTCFDIGWGTLRVRGIGNDAVSAVEDGERKLRAAIAEQHPEVVLPV